MLKKLNANLVIVAGLIYNLCLITLFTYVIFWLDHSGWWYIFMIMLLANITQEKSESNQKDVKLTKN